MVIAVGQLASPEWKKRIWNAFNFVILGNVAFDLGQPRTVVASEHLHPPADPQQRRGMLDGPIDESRLGGVAFGSGVTWIVDVGKVVAPSQDDPGKILGFEVRRNVIQRVWERDKAIAKALQQSGPLLIEAVPTLSGFGIDLDALAESELQIGLPILDIARF